MVRIVEKRLSCHKDFLSPPFAFEAAAVVCILRLLSLDEQQEQCRREERAIKALFHVVMSRIGIEQQKVGNSVP